MPPKVFRPKTAQLNAPPVYRPTGNSVLEKTAVERTEPTIFNPALPGSSAALPYGTERILKMHLPIPSASSIVQLSKFHDRKKLMKVQANRALAIHEQHGLILAVTTKTAVASKGNRHYRATSGAGGAVAVPAWINPPWANLVPVAGIAGFINCAEAHIWNDIVSRGENPLYYDLRVIDYRGAVAEPCPNCRQWVYQAFKTVNA